MNANLLITLIEMYAALVNDIQYIILDVTSFSFNFLLQTHGG